MGAEMIINGKKLNNKQKKEILVEEDSFEEANM